jgi:hypothetical protein
MCDIVIGILLAVKIAQLAGTKGRSKAPWVILLLVLYFGGEIAGGLVGWAASGGEDMPNVGFIVGAIVGAAMGAIISFAVLNGLPPVRRDEDEYWQPPESERYREKFDAGKYRGTADADKYRPREDEDADRSPPGEDAYRPKSDEV